MKVLIPSYNRPSNVKTLSSIPELYHDDVTLLVRPEEQSDYMASYGDTVNIHAIPGSIDNLQDTREYVGVYAEKMGYPNFLMLDDDVKLFWMDSNLKLHKMDEEHFQTLTDKLEEMMLEYKHVTISPRFMNQMRKEEFKELSCVETSVTAYDTEAYNLIPFDDDCLEDLNRTLWLCMEGYPICTLNTFAVDPGPLQTKGGFSKQRNDERHKKSVNKMLERYGSWLTCTMKEDYYEKGTYRNPFRVSWKKIKQYIEDVNNDL